MDFEKLEDAGLKAGNWDVVFITYGLYLGKAVHITDLSPGWELREVLLDQQQPSRKLIGSELKPLVRIMHAWLIQIFRYVVSAAHAAKIDDRPQRLVYLSVSLNSIFRLLCFTSFDSLQGQTRHLPSCIRSK